MGTKLCLCCGSSFNWAPVSHLAMRSTHPVTEPSTTVTNNAQPRTAAVHTHTQAHGRSTQRYRDTSVVSPSNHLTGTERQNRHRHMHLTNTRQQTSTASENTHAQLVDQLLPQQQKKIPQQQRQLEKYFHLKIWAPRYPKKFLVKTTTAHVL